jgi:type I restriction enzyme R subunit
VGSQLRANADVWEDFTAGHYAFPPFTLMGGLPEAMRVFGGSDALDALLESLNAAVFPPPADGNTDSAPDQPAATQ